jgi:hypothetical protein
MKHLPLAALLALIGCAPRTRVAVAQYFAKRGWYRPSYWEPTIIDQSHPGT